MTNPIIIFVSSLCLMCSESSFAQFTLDKFPNDNRGFIPLDDPAESDNFVNLLRIREVMSPQMMYYWNVGTPESKDLQKHIESLSVLDTRNDPEFLLEARKLLPNLLNNFLVQSGFKDENERITVLIPFYDGLSNYIFIFDFKTVLQERVSCAYILRDNFILGCVDHGYYDQFKYLAVSDSKARLKFVEVINTMDEPNSTTLVNAPIPSPNPLKPRLIEIHHPSSDPMSTPFIEVPIPSPKPRVFSYLDF